MQNPPTYKDVTVRYGELQTLSGTGLAIEGPPALNVFEYEGDLPASTQWNFGVQMMLPWNTSLDVEYVGQHSYRTLEGVDLNSVDYGAAYLSVNQDATLTPNPAVPGSTAVSQDRMRARGHAGINQQLGRGVRTTTRPSCVPALRERLLVRVQRHDRPRSSAAGAHPAQRGRHVVRRAPSSG